MHRRRQTIARRPSTDSPQREFDWASPRERRLIEVARRCEANPGASAKARIWQRIKDTLEGREGEGTSLHLGLLAIVSGAPSKRLA